MRFEPETERWIWAALGGLILAVAATLILWFPLEKTEDVLLSPKDRGSDQHGSQALVALQESQTTGPGQERLARLRARFSQRDPFLSMAEAKWVQFLGELALRAPRLEGVLKKDGELFALIRGRLFRPGDQVEGFLIESIGPQWVELSKGGRLVQVRLKEPGGQP